MIAWRESSGISIQKLDLEGATFLRISAIIIDDEAKGSMKVAQLRQIRHRDILDWV